RQTNNIEHFVLVRLWLAFCQPGGEINPHLLFEKAWRHKEFRKFIEPFGYESELLFELARGSCFGTLAVRKRAGRDFEQVTDRGMAILSHKHDGAVVVDRHDHGAARVMDHVALIRKLTFNDGVDCDFENAAVEYFLAAQYLW